MTTKPKLLAGHSRSSKQRAALRKEGAFQLKAVLADSDPPIWRRIQVPGKATLSFLHRVLQDAMGWENCHLHEFKIKGISYGSVAEGDDPFALDMRADKGFLLEDVLSESVKSFQYIYDFGDDWVHEITVEKRGLAEAGATYPVCLGGDRACPPEDCGGIDGYYANLEILKDMKHPDYEDVKEWMGRHDPARFNSELVNVRLKRLAK